MNPGLKNWNPGFETNINHKSKKFNQTLNVHKHKQLKTNTSYNQNTKIKTHHKTNLVEERILLIFD